MTENEFATAQTFMDFKLFCGDCSTDNSVAFVKSCASNYDDGVVSRRRIKNLYSRTNDTLPIENKIAAC